MVKALVLELSEEPATEVSIAGVFPGGDFGEDVLVEGDVGGRGLLLLLLLALGDEHHGLLVSFDLVVVPLLYDPLLLLHHRVVTWKDWNRF